MLLCLSSATLSGASSVKRLGFALAALVAMSAPAFAQGVPDVATVVNACGTPPVTYTAGQNRAVLQNTSGQVCGASVSTPSGTQNVTVTSTVNPLGITPTDRTIASATGSSQTVMTANAARHSLTIENTGTANCGVNPTGGTAIIGGAGTLTLFPGGSYSPRIPPLAAVTAICTSTQPLYANEN